MARSVKFHGRVIVHPGAEAYVDLSGMVQPGVDDTKIGAAIAEASYGQPGVLHVFADDKAARDYFGAGSDAANAVKFLMDPASDDRITGGATLVYVYKPNRSTQAEYWMVQDPWVGNVATGDRLMTRTVRDAGTYDGTADPPNAWVEFDLGAPAEPDNYYKGLIVEIISGWGKGQQREVVSSSTVGGRQRLLIREDLDWNVVPTHSTNTPALRLAVPQTKLYSTEWGPRGLENEVDFGPASVQEALELASRYAKRVEVQPSAFGGLNKPTMFLKFDPTGGGALSDWTDESNWIVPQAIDTMTANPCEGACNALATATNLTNGALMTASQHFNRWVLITGISTNPARAAVQQQFLGKMYKIRNNGTNDLTLYGDGLGTGLSVGVLEDLYWKVVAFTDAYILPKGSEGRSTSLEVWIKDAVIGSGAGAWQTKLTDLSLSMYPTLTNLVKKFNDVPGMDATLGDGVDGSLSTERFDFGRLADSYDREKVGLLRTPIVAATAPGNQRIDIQTPNPNEGFEGSDVFPTDMYPYCIILDEDGANEELVLITGNDTVTNDRLTASVPVTKDHLVGEVVSLASNEETAYRRGSQLAYGPGDDADGYVVRDNNQKLAEWITTYIGRFDAERATNDVSSAFEDQVGGVQPENNRDVWKKFYHGEVGDSVMEKPPVSDPFYPISWEDGLNELLKQEGIRTEAMAVSADLPSWNTGDFERFMIRYQQHLLDCEGNRTSRQGYMGATLPLEAGTIQGVTYTKGLLDWIRTLNEERMALTGQEIKRYDSNDVEVWLPPWAQACEGAGIQMGTDVGEGLTLKYIKASDVRSPLNDWDPRDPVDSRKAVLGGLFYCRPKKGKWRITRGQSTHVSTNNLARTDINVWEIRNLVMEDMRDQLEERFGGAGIGTDAEGVRYVAPARISSVREQCATILEEYRADGWIVDSEDENKRPLHAWNSLSVRISGDICRVKVLVYPKTALNFILIDFQFQLPTLSA